MMMKFKVLLATLFLSVSTYAVNLRANCWVNGGVNAVCEACNFSYHRPIFCSMQVRGVSSRGFWFNGMQSGVVYPGQCINGYVYANNPYIDPLVHATANTQCQF